MVELRRQFQAAATYVSCQSGQGANRAVFFRQARQIGIAGDTAQSVMGVCTAQQAWLGRQKARKFCADVKQVMG
jgi:hypothetical protein